MFRTRFAFCVVGVMAALFVLQPIAQSPRLTPPQTATLPTNCNPGDMVAKTGAATGLYVCTATNTWSGPVGASTGGTVTTSGSPSSGNLAKFSGATAITNADLSGDITTSGGVATTLATSGVSAGSYGSSTQVGTFTVDAKGRLTAASNTSISSSGIAYPDFTAPVAANFAAVNAGSSSLTSTTIQGASGLFFLGTAQAGPALHLYTQAISSSWTRTAAFIPRLTSASFSAAGMAVRNSGAGTIIIFTYDGDTGNITISKWNSATSFNAVYSTQSLYRISPSLVCFRIGDDTANRTYSLAADCKNYVAVHSTTSSDFLTADEVGFIIKDQNVTYSPAMTLMSWN